MILCWGEPMNVVQSNQPHLLAELTTVHSSTFGRFDQQLLDGFHEVWLKPTFDLPVYITFTGANPRIPVTLDRAGWRCTLVKIDRDRTRKVFYPPELIPYVNKNELLTAALMAADLSLGQIVVTGVAVTKDLTSYLRLASLNAIRRRERHHLVRVAVLP